MKVAIAPDFEHLLPAPSDAELAQLEKNCLDDPKHERMPPVILWANHKNTIVDGHNQYRIRTKHGLKIKYVRVDFESRDEAMRYALDVQFGRRNLDASQRAMAYAKLPRKPEGKPNSNSANLPSIEELAESAGVSERTMTDAARVADKSPTPIVKAVQSGEIKVSDAAAISALPKSEQTAALRAVQSGEAKTLRAAVASEPEESEPLEDAVGNPIPDRLTGAFEYAATFKEQSRALGLIKKWANDLPNELGCCYFHKQSFIGELNGLQQQLKFEAPYAVCPYCLSKKRVCEACKGRGFVTKPIYDGAPSELRV